MATSILAAMTRIVAIQAGLSITSPVAMAVKRAHTFVPPQSQALPDLPCFLNELTGPTIETDRMMSQRDQRYSVQMLCVVAKAGVEDDRSALMAVGFLQAALDAFCADVSLNDTVTLALLRGSEPTVAVIQRGNEAYIGFNATLDIRIEEPFLWS